jgi:hypothetical protein
LTIPRYNGKTSQLFRTKLSHREVGTKNDSCLSDERRKIKKEKELAEELPEMLEKGKISLDNI